MFCVHCIHVQIPIEKVAYGDQFDSKLHKLLHPPKPVFNCITATLISRTNVTWWKIALLFQKTLGSK